MSEVILKRMNLRPNETSSKIELIIEFQDKGHAVFIANTDNKQQVASKLKMLADKILEG